MEARVSIGILIGTSIGICSALPIPTAPASDRNLFIVGALALLSFGAVLTGCVCCRRRKKGFEENLIVEDTDNNNGPISPADLENIENNNAVDYIENQNVDVVVEPIIDQRHSDLGAIGILIEEDMVMCHPEHIIQDVIVSSTTDHTLPTLETSTISSYVNEKNFSRKQSFEEFNQKQPREVLEAIIKPESVPITNHAKTINTPIRRDEQAFIHSSDSDSEIEFIFDDTDNIELTPVDARGETTSIKSNASEKSNEISSVEEALRALDNAIENDDVYGDDDDDDNEDENEELNYTSESELPLEAFSFLVEDNHLDKDEELPTETIDLENVRCQVIQLVDEILFESQKIVEQKLIESELKTKENTIIIEEHPKTDFNTDIESNDVLQRANSFEDFSQLLAKSSTPCIQSKFAASETATKTKSSKALIFGDDLKNSPEINQINIALTEDDDLRPLACNATFNATFDATKPNINATFDANNGTFDINNKTYNGLDYTYPGDPCTSKQAMERDEGYNMKCQRDEVRSDDLNTITPVNTPIELNYNKDTWNKMTTTDQNNGWFLHPQSAIDAQKDEGIGNDYNSGDEENEENLELTFEALRKQLAEVLPQQGSVQGPTDFSDDFDNDSESSNRTYDEYRNPLIDALLEIDNGPEVQNEMVINYKRSLSPIMEESEEDLTCKTFAINETKILDNSTSTGCVETSEAIMGVSKNLMASNDTLFNFEDTLGDKDDSSLISPKLSSGNDSEATTPVKSSIASSLPISNNNSQATTITTSSETEKVYCSPAEDESEIFCEEDDLSFNDKGIVSRKPTLIAFDFQNMKVVEDICSPSDQQKTFSEGTQSSSNTTDRVSSDMSPTLDNDATFTTNTNDACITVIIKDDDDERISEISEPEWGSTVSGAVVPAAIASIGTTIFMEDQDLNSLADIPSLDVNYHDNDLDLTSDHEDSGHSTQEPSTDGKSNTTSHNTNISDSNEYLNSKNDSVSEELELENFKENTDPNITYSNTKAPTNTQQNSTTTSNSSIIEHNNSGSVMGTTVSINQKVQMNNCQDAVIIDKSKTNKCVNEGNINNIEPYETVTHIQHDNNVTCAESLKNGTIQEDDLKTTSFMNKSDDEELENEWDSDIDEDNSDSHDDSSEEFMYVHGTPSKDQIESYNSTQAKDSRTIDEHLNSEKLWSHDDQIQVKITANEIVQNADSGDSASSSDMEGEFVPSSWNSSAMPARSALKSPDKSSSEEESQQIDNKKRRSVVFKKQRYFSVYEYPKEVPISPTYNSDPNIEWNSSRGSNIFDAHKELVEEFSDGFTVSSTTRPFHGSQFNAMCHTWPTDADFSWSQIEESDDNKFVTYSNSIADIKWDKVSDLSVHKDENEQRSSDDSGRPDSGVGESAELLSERPTIGGLCHTKSSLRLPIEGFSTSPIETSNVECRLFPEAVVLPTPSCTGSMDSLNSNSSSERQMSFTTFNKKVDESSSSTGNNSFSSKSCGTSSTSSLTGRPTINIILYEDDRFQENNVLNSLGDKVKQNDSTDEDSGIESIMRINK